MRLGIVANEFFDRGRGRMGGFGWAARQVAQACRRQPELGIDVLFLAARPPPRGGVRVERVHDTPLVSRWTGPSYAAYVRALGLDALLTVDYRPSYRTLLEVLPRCPAIVWVRDPRGRQAEDRIATLRLPETHTVGTGYEASADGETRTAVDVVTRLTPGVTPAPAPTPAPPPVGIQSIDCRSLSIVRETSDARGRPLLFAAPALSLAASIPEVYGVAGADAHCVLLPNIVDAAAVPIVKSATPRVVFLGRLDPIKRPWLFVALARRLPDVEFLVLGQPHFRGDGAWSPPRDVPPNLRLLGHVDGAEKWRLLASAWALVNTSIHEALATSFLEALACEIPLIACTDQERVVSRFGRCVRWSAGDGLASVDDFALAISQLVDDHALRTRLGREGRAWVEQTHTSASFLAALDRLCVRAGLARRLRAARSNGRHLRDARRSHAIDRRSERP